MFTGLYKEVQIIGLNSQGTRGEAMSSYLGELQRLYWDLNETCSIVQGRKLILLTDFQSAIKRTKRHDADLKSLYDIGVACLLSWLWENFLEEILEVKFIPEMYTKIANLRFRWRGEMFTDV